MSKRMLCLVALLALIVCGVYVFAAPDVEMERTAQADMLRCTIRVADISKKPVEGAAVAFLDAQKAVLSSSKTGANGIAILEIKKSASVAFLRAQKDGKENTLKVAAERMEMEMDILL